VGAITGYPLKKLADLGLEKAKDTLRKSKGKLGATVDDVESALNHHIREVKNWSAEISFSDLRTGKSTSEVFVPLDVFLHPRRRHVSSVEVGEVKPLDALLDDLFTPPSPPPISPEPTPPDPPLARHVIILGQPGAGKTTSMKHLCHRLLNEDAFLQDHINLPILIRLRDINPRSRSLPDGPDKLSEGDFLLSLLQDIVGLRITYPDALIGDENRAARRTLRDRIVIDFLDSLKALIIFDGLDEVIAKSRKDAVVQQLRTLALQLESSHIILTSRTGEFNYHIDNMLQFELTPLSQFQIATFVSRWLGHDDGARLLAQLAKSPYNDTAIRPLTIAHLCAIYEKAGRIPDKPKTVYRKIVNLLLEEWDEQRSVKRESAYAHFEIDRKSEFLANLAYVLTTSFRRPTYDKEDFIRAYSKICENFGLPLAEAAKVANELESHTGLFVQAGYESYEFSHKSLQEYLAADFIVKLPSIPSKGRSLLILPNELAIATAISSRPSDYFAHLVLDKFESLQPTFDFIRTFVTRLLLESPSFERSTIVGVALVSLYSRYLNLVQKNTSQLSLFIYDQLATEFSTLGDMIRERVSMEELLALYEVEGKSAGHDGVEIMVLARKNRTKSSPPAGRLQPVLTQLPMELWVRGSLLHSDN
jgi:GTPase SAR1 family protein